MLYCTSVCLSSGHDKVLLVSSTQTVVEFTPSAVPTCICNMEIKVSCVVIFSVPPSYVPFCIYSICLFSRCF